MFQIELVKAGLFGAEGAHTYTTSGMTTTQTWPNLGGGTYHLVFDSTNDDPGCQLVGRVAVNITP